MTRPDEPYSLLQVSLLRTVPLSLLKLCESDGPVAVDLLPSLLFAVATDTLGTTVRSFIQVCIKKKSMYFSLYNNIFNTR